MRRKAILVPRVQPIAAFALWAVTPPPMVVGAFLCDEGFRKLVHAMAQRGVGDAAAGRSACCGLIQSGAATPGIHGLCRRVATLL